MTERQIRENDELESLINSIENDDTMKRKMDAFSQRKQRKRRLQRMENVQNTQPIPVVTPPPVHTQPSQDAGETMVMPATSASATQSKDTSKTTVFQPGVMQSTSDIAHNETVVINDNEIQTLLEEKKQKPKPPVQKKKSSMPIVIGILSVFAALMLGFGIYTMVSGNTVLDTTSDTSETTDQEFEQLLGWANNYNSLSESGKREIVDYEEIYNKCSDKQKAQIDAILKEKCGKTFNQLLASAKSNKKVDSKNNDVKKAEEKAKLREEIAALQNQLAVAQTALQSTVTDMSTKEAELNEIQTKIDEANAQIVQAQTDLAAAQEAMNAQSEDEDEEQDSNDASQAYEKALEAYEKASKVDIAGMQQEYSEKEAAYSQLAAQQVEQQSQVDSINAQIQALQNELSAL